MCARAYVNSRWNRRSSDDLNGPRMYSVRRPVKERNRERIFSFCAILIARGNTLDVVSAFRSRLLSFHSVDCFLSYVGVSLLFSFISFPAPDRFTRYRQEKPLLKRERLIRSTAGFIAFQLSLMVIHVSRSYDFPQRVVSFFFRPFFPWETSSCVEQTEIFSLQRLLETRRFSFSTILSIILVETLESEFLEFLSFNLKLLSLLLFYYYFVK